MVQPQILEGTGHTRSLLERCVLASGRVHQLREQYRMHPRIAGLVSERFYAGRLLTPASVTQERQAQEHRPLLWMDVQGREEAPNKSYLNRAEVSACVRVATRLRERIGMEPSVALLTFYKGQLEELMKAVPNDLDVEVLTVDACQGSEFDFVILSTVRANRELRLGFVKDAQRICVATSRSRLQLFVVGHRQTLSGDGDWRKVAEACTTPKPDEVQPQGALPERFVSVFDALRRAKEQEAEQKALQAMEEQSKGSKGRGKSTQREQSAVSYYGAGPSSEGDRPVDPYFNGDEAAKLWGRDADGEGDEFPGPIGWESIAGLPESTSEAPGSREELQVSRRASFDELKASRQASFDHTGSRSVKGSASPVSEKAEKTGLFVCWLCRRKFDTSEKFDLHVLHSKLHQETIRQLAGLA
ncbi:unnamed protein product [Durusdinium trenchii]